MVLIRSKFITRMLLILCLHFLQLFTIVAYIHQIHGDNETEIQTTDFLTKTFSPCLSSCSFVVRTHASLFTGLNFVVSFTKVSGRILLSLRDFAVTNLDREIPSGDDHMNYSFS